VSKRSRRPRASCRVRQCSRKGCQKEIHDVPRASKLHEMNLRAVTDIILGPGKLRSGPSVTMAKRNWLLCLLVAGAFVATIVAVHPWKSEAAIAEVRSMGATRTRIAERAPMTQPAEVALRDSREERNPAVQKAGPPDPESQRTAAASAERAAQAAADLAAAQ
jgi:hypothetical protein